MSTSHTTHFLSKPTGDARIPNGVIDYITTRNRMRLFSVVQNEFAQSKITQTELARRMGKDTDRVCHLLGAPGNWTADTAGSFIFAISGGILNYTVSYRLVNLSRRRG